MSQESLLTIFIGLVAFAFVLQSFAFLGMFFSVRKISRRFDELSKKLEKQVETLSGKADEALAAAQEALAEAKAWANSTKQVRENLTSVTGLMQKRAVELDKVVETRVADLDSFLQESTEFARGQLSRMEGVIDRSADRIDETFDIVHKGILTPLTELNAIVMGLKVGLDVLFRRRRPSTKIHQDEEMFI